MAIAVTNEKETHFTMKEICEMTLNFFMVCGYPNLKVVTEKNVGRFIPDVLYYSGDTLIACLEVVNFNPMSQKKKCHFKNMNMNLYSVKVTNWTIRYEGIPFVHWKNDFMCFFTDVMTGTNNGYLVNTESMKDKHQNAIIDGVHVSFVRYEVEENDINEVIGLYNVMAYDAKGNSYHLVFMSNVAERAYSKQHKKVSSLRKGKEPIYLLKSEEKCWIDALDITPMFDTV